jgi:hypothetical protein
VRPRLAKAVGVGEPVYRVAHSRAKQEHSAHARKLRHVQFRADFIDRLRQCLEEGGNWYAVERCFTEAVDDEEVDDAKPLVWAFGYMLVGGRREELRDRSGVFAPQLEIGGSSFPPRLAEIPGETPPLWAAYAKALDQHPLAASRLHDLLWVLRDGERPIDHARAAVDAYVQLADALETMDLVDCLSRAIEIAGEIGDAGRMAAAVRKAVNVIETEIAETNERRPGIPMNLLEAIAALRPEHRPENLMDLVTAAGERYGDDPWIAQSVSELRSSLSSVEERATLALEQVERWRAEAQKSAGLLRYAHLQHALELARKHGASEQAEAILVELQSITPEDLDLKTLSAEVSIPREKIDPYIKSFGEQDSWQAALERFGAAGPPVHAAPAEQPDRKTTLSRIFPTQVLGSQSSLVFGASAERDHDRLDSSRDDALQIQLWGFFSVEILETIRGRFGVPPRDELVEFFTSELIDSSIAARLADALLRFFDGDDDGALHIVIPQVEAGIRSAAAHLHIVVIKNPQGERPGGVRQLGALLADLRGRMDETWRRYLVNALNDSLGLNLRDQVSHGLYGPVSRADVAIALHIALHLRSWSVTEGEGGESE